MEKTMKKIKIWLPWWSCVKNPPANAGDMGSIPVQEDSTCIRATKPMPHHN